MKIRKLHIDNYKIFQDFDLNLTHNEQTQNLIVIAGINGSGKTTLLKECIYQTFEEQRIVGNGFVEVEYREHDQDTIVTINRDIVRQFGDVIFFEAGISDTVTAREAIVRFIDRLIYENDKKSSEAYRMTQEILETIFHDFDVQITFKGLNKDRDVLFSDCSGGEFSIQDLSSGEQELITKAFSLYLADIRESLILIDEPERSLHPTWQDRIIQIYQRLADENQNQIILATHSPHIVASVRKEQIRVLVRDNGSVRVLDSFTGSYGWRIDRVLLEIFRTNGLRTPEVEEKLTTLRNLVFENEFDSDAFRQLHTELERTLGSDDMDLTLIRMEIAKRKRNREETDQERTPILS